MSQQYCPGIESEWFLVLDASSAFFSLFVFSRHPSAKSDVNKFPTFTWRLNVLVYRLRTRKWLAGRLTTLVYSGTVVVRTTGVCPGTVPQWSPRRTSSFFHCNRRPSHPSIVSWWQNDSCLGENWITWYSVHDTGSSFIPVRLHPISNLSIYLRLIHYTI